MSYIRFEMLKAGTIYVRRPDIVTFGDYVNKKHRGVMLLLVNGERVAVQGTLEEAAHIIDANTEITSKG